jgi:hypothetical protein
MVLSNAPARVRRVASSTSKTSVFGSMPGSAPSVGRGTNTSVAYNRSGLNCANKCLPTGTPAEQYSYLLSRGLIFNSKLTGGTGRQVYSNRCCAPKL